VKLRFLVKKRVILCYISDFRPYTDRKRHKIELMTKKVIRNFGRYNGNFFLKRSFENLVREIVFRPPKLDAKSPPTDRTSGVFRGYLEAMSTLFRAASNFSACNIRKNNGPVAYGSNSKQNYIFYPLKSQRH